MKILHAALLALALLVPAPARAQDTCTVKVRMTDAVEFRSVQVLIGYGDAAGSFGGCTNRTTATPTIDDDMGARELSLGLLSVGTVAAPATLFECLFDNTDDLRAEDFVVSVEDATDEDLVPLNPLPAVVVELVGCAPTTTTTTTTLPGTPCQVDFVLSDDIELGSLQWDVDYSGAAGDFLGSGDDVECVTAVTDGLAAATDHDDTRELVVGVISLGGNIVGPDTVTSCTFVATDDVAPEDFAITVVDASDPDNVVVSPLPAMSVSLVGCNVSTTTTSTTTTTTLAPQSCTIDIDITSEHADIGSLQFHVDFGDAAGSIASAGDCTGRAGGTPVFNLQPEFPRLNAAIISLSPFSAPRTVVTCEFADSGPVHGSDFAVMVESASDSLAFELNPLPTMAVRPRGCQTSCGDGNVDDDEDCDDGNIAADDGCSPACRWEQLCGDPNDNGSITATDALLTLQAAVGLFSCPLYVCDVDGNPGLSATDALRVLLRTVNSSIVLMCPRLG